MLKILRNKKTAKKVWIGLAIIIIPAFTLWGFGGGARNKEEKTTAGRISGHNISDLEFKESITAVRTQGIIQFGDKFPEIEKYLNLPAQAWDRLILLYEAKKRRIRVSDKEVVDFIQSVPYFQDKSGFSNKIYQEILRYVFRLQPRVYEEQVRQGIILNKLYRQVTDKIKLSDEQIRQEYLRINEELSIDYIAGLSSDFTKKINPTDKEITDYFEKNKAMFKVPPSENQKTYIPELAQVKDKVKEAFIKENSRKAAETKIKECAELLKKNNNLSQAAAASGLKTGSTNFFKSSDQIKELGSAVIFWDAAKKIPKDQYSGILSDEKGFYIIGLKSIKPIDEKKFKEEKPAFSEKLLAANKNEAFAEFTDELRKKAQ